MTARLLKMADDKQPPPLFGDDDDLPATGDNNNPFDNPKDKILSNSTNIKDLEDEPDDLFADAKTEISLESPDDSPNARTNGIVAENNKPLTIHTANAEHSEAAIVSLQPAVVAEKKKTEEELEDEDKVEMDIQVTDPVKKGDGMSAYMAYKVVTSTALPQFRKKEMGVFRRFSDFLGLHEKLVTKHQCMGRIVPPPPEKSVVGMTKVKMSKEESNLEFIEKRRASLERFLRRTSKHPSLRLDPDFREFLELDGELPKSTSTSALSGAGMKRLFNKVGDSFGKIAFKMDETDQWFEEQQARVEELDIQMHKLHGSIESLVAHRRELSTNTGAFSKSLSLMANAEEHVALSRALSQLSEVEEHIQVIHDDQADNDFYVLSELMKDYINLIGAVKEVFLERVKIFRTWKEAEVTLNKKREAKAKLEIQRKMDKVPSAQSEINEWEGKVEKGQEEFERISNSIRKEMVRFDRQRIKDFKNTIINYLESLMNSQQQVIQHWESFLPEAKAVA